MIGANGQGEIAWTPCQSVRAIGYGPDEITNYLLGLRRMDELACAGSAALYDYGSLQIEVEHHNAVKPFSNPFEPSSTGC